MTLVHELYSATSVIWKTQDKTMTLHFRLSRMTIIKTITRIIYITEIS